MIALNAAPYSLSISETPSTHLNIKIMGIGGAGTNVVQKLQLGDFGTVRLAAVNTDAQALANCSIPEKLMIGGSVTRGLGTGGELDVGKAAAESDREAIATLIGDLDLLILIVGLGGGTGTATAALVAEIAAGTNVLLLTFATLPFSFEGSRRLRIAEEGLCELRKSVHGLIPLPNDVLLQEGDDHTSVLDAFAIADQWIGRGVQALCAMLLKTGLINQDFASLRSVFQTPGGKTIFGIGRASGGDYVKDALDDLFLCPLLHMADRPKRLDRMLIQVIGGADLSMSQVNEMVSLVAKRLGSREDLVLGAVIDDTGSHSLEICVLGKAEMERNAPARNAKATKLPSSAKVRPMPVLESEIAGHDSPSVPRVHTSKLTKKKSVVSANQDEFNFSEVDDQRGYFEKTDRNDYKNEDLDVPTYLRRGIKIKLKV